MAGPADMNNSSPSSGVPVVAMAVSKRKTFYPSGKRHRPTLENMKLPRCKRLRWLLLCGTLLGTQALASDASSGTGVKPDGPSRIWSEEDGWLDISGFLDQAYGFVPLAIPITEPAVGLGAVGALVFIDKQNGKV